MMVEVVGMRVDVVLSWILLIVAGIMRMLLVYSGLE
jgi:hypothetical protein